MRRFVLDLTGLVSCVAFASACYLWMGWLQAAA